MHSHETFISLGCPICLTSALFIFATIPQNNFPPKISYVYFWSFNQVPYLLVFKKSWLEGYFYLFPFDIFSFGICGGCLCFYLVDFCFFFFYIILLGGLV